jgi:hypothetical protein
VDALRGSRAFLAWDCHAGCGFVSGLFARQWPLALMDCPPPEAPIWISRSMRIPSQRVCLGSRSDRRSITSFALPFVVALAANADQAGCGAR